MPHNPSKVLSESSDREPSKNIMFDFFLAPKRKPSMPPLSRKRPLKNDRNPGASSTLVTVWGRPSTLRLMGAPIRSAGIEKTCVCRGAVSAPLQSACLWSARRLLYSSAELYHQPEFFQEATTDCIAGSLRRLDSLKKGRLSSTVVSWFAGYGGRGAPCVFVIMVVT